MPNQITVSQINSMRTQIQNGGVSAVRQAYGTLGAAGYRYATLADGVAGGNTFSGRSALEFMRNTASDYGRTLTDGQVDQIRVDMALGYLNELARNANSEGVVTTDVSAAQAASFHTEQFQKNELPIDVWTLNEVFAGMTEGQRESYWNSVLTSAGNAQQELSLAVDTMRLMVQREAEYANTLSFDFQYANTLKWEANAFADKDNVGDFISLGIDVGSALFRQWLSENAQLLKIRSLLEPRDSDYRDIKEAQRLFKETYDSIVDPLHHQTPIVPNPNPLFPIPPPPPPSPPSPPNPTPRSFDPLILDLDGNGVTTTSIGGGVFFDLDASGFAERTAWVSPTDGLLCVDLDGDGLITSGLELFGNSTGIDYGNFINGYQALYFFAHSHSITQGTEAYNRLRVWVDANSNGRSDNGELFTLNQLNIQSIEADNYESDYVDPSGNEHRQVSTYQTFDGATHATSDVWLNVDARQSLQRNKVDVSDRVDALPFLAGFYDVPDLDQAMMRDSTGQLTELVEAYVAEADATTRHAIFARIFSTWVGLNDPIDTRGFNMRLDLDPLRNNTIAISTRVIGELADYYGFVAESIDSSEFQDISNRQYAAITRSYNLLLTGLENDLLKQVSPLSSESSVTYRDYLSERLGTTGNDVFTGTVNNEFYHGDAGNDRITGGDGNDELLGGSGNDVILGDAGDDNIAGGIGNDELSGGTGNDYIAGNSGGDKLFGNDGDDFLFGGAGNDELHGQNGNDRLYASSVNNNAASGSSRSSTIDYDLIGNSYVESDMSVGISYLYGEEGDDMLFGHFNTVYLFGGNGNDSLSGSNDVDFLYGESGDDNINGSYGSDNIFGGDGEDLIYGSWGNDVVFGGAGRDVIYGDDNQIYLANPNDVSEIYDDVLFGEAGEDFIGGNLGDDRLNGGFGNDVLTGGIGNDQYEFAVGDGVDRIEEFGMNVEQFDLGNGVSSRGGTDSISFLGGITSSEIRILRDGADVLLSKVNGSDSVRIVNWYNLQSSQVENVRFADGTVWSSDYIHRQNYSIYGTDNNDTLYGGTALGLGDALYGSVGDDILWGKEGDDILNGGDDQDTLHGEDGNDSLFGDGGQDKLFGEGGDDKIDGGAGIDQITDLSGDNSLFGGGDADLIQSGLGSDRISGGTGDDLISDAGGSNVVSGGDGDDTIIISAGSNEIQGDAGNDRVLSGDGDDRIFGGTGNDLIFTGDGSNMVMADADNDVVIGGRGDDKIYGGAGSDVISGSSGADRLFGNGGEDVLIGGLGKDYMEGSDGDDLMLGDGIEGAEAFSQMYVQLLAATTQSLADLGRSANLPVPFVNDYAGLGPGDADVLLGCEGNDTMLGGGGDDQLFGGIGSDRLVGGTGDDLLEGEEDDDQLDGSEGNDFLKGASGNDILKGGEGNDRLDGGIGHDTLSGDAGDDLLFGAEGLDRLLGGEGNDQLDGGADKDVLEGGAGNDQLAGGADIDTLLGGEGNDRLDGGDGDDVIEGGNGADVLIGGAGNDVMGIAAANVEQSGGLGDTYSGGTGNDVLKGSVYADTYLFNIGDGQDRIIENGASTFTDILRFGNGITANNIEVQVSGLDLLLRRRGSTDSVTVTGWMVENRTHIERVEFADGTVWNETNLQAALLNSTALSLTQAISTFNPTGAAVTPYQTVMSTEPVPLAVSSLNH